MDKWTSELVRMSKIEPSKGFIEASKNRLMQRIALQKSESWFKAFLARLGMASVSQTFMFQARVRLMNRITNLPQPIRIPLRGLALFFSYTKKVVASTLVMVLAVTATLFFVEGKAVVVASDESYLEVVAGTASVKHPDLLVWEDINGLMDVQAGDLIKVEDGSEAVVHFFDDSELRLGANSLLLISQLAVSPGFGGQAVVEVSLHEGSAWVQTLNVDDGYAGFTLYTRDAVMKTINGTFDVTTKLNAPTSVMVMSKKLDMATLQPDTRDTLEDFRLTANQRADIRITNNKPVVVTESVSQQDLANEWVQSNLRKDGEHLTVLREKGIERLTQMAGTLPGQMLYPIKQAKERLQLALSSSADSGLQIEIANRRLSEALVLFESGDQQKGREALLAYQTMAKQIADAKGVKQLTNKLIIPHQKVLAAELPNDVSTSLVKEALHQTAEILADSPVELGEVQLVNSIQRLQDVAALVKQGDLKAAKERLASQQLAESDALKAVESITDEALKKAALQKILGLRQEEQTLLASLSEMLKTQVAGDELLIMVKAASKNADENVEMIMAAVLPFAPELQLHEETAVAKASALDIKTAEVVKKINVYKTWEGQRNQIERLLENELKNPKSIAYLMNVRNSLNVRAYDYLNSKILQLEKKADFQKHKAVQIKIERAQSLRAN